MKRFSYPTLGLLVASAFGITACVSTPEFAANGTPSPYDGKWSGDFSSQMSTCQGITGDFEIRYGQLIGVIRKDGVKKADIWGQLSEQGQLNGNIGKMGISGGDANITFAENTATGSWYGSGCKGQVSLKKG